MSNSYGYREESLGPLTWSPLERKLLDIYGVNDVSELPPSVRRDFEAEVFRIMDEENTASALERVRKAQNYE